MPLFHCQKDYNRIYIVSIKQFIDETDKQHLFSAVLLNKLSYNCGGVWTDLYNIYIAYNSTYPGIVWFMVKQLVQ